MNQMKDKPVQSIAIMLIAAAALLSFIRDADAQVINDSSFVVGCFSYHADRNAGYNESHSCFGVEHKGWTGMYFVNSEDNPSFLGSYSKSFWHLSEHVMGGVSAGFVTGYSRGDVLPFIAPKISYDNEHVGLDVHFMPYPVPVASVNLRLKF